MAVVDYSELYRDLNQISMDVDRVEFSEVMVIHRMYVRLADLDVGELVGAEGVKRIYVFADVVELAPGIRMQMPGSVTVIIMCRLLQFPTDGSQAATLQLPYMKLHALLRERYTSEITAADGMNWGTYIHGEEIQVITPWTTRNSVLQVWADGAIITSSFHNVFDEPGRIVSTTVFTRPGAPDNTNVSAQPGMSILNSFLLYTVSPSAFSVLARQSSNISFTNIPVDVVTDPNILLGMQTNVLIAELVKVCHPSPDIFAAVAEHLNWLNKILLQVVQNETQLQGTESYNECLALLGRIQSVMKIARLGLVVPQLQYRMYSSLITQMAQVAENYDRDFKQFKLFIIQNQILGSYLLQQNKAFADRELQMENFHSVVISQRKEELDSAITKIERLSLQMEAENGAMEQAKKEMDEGLRKYQNEQVARAVFAVLSAIAQIALAFVTGGATAPGAVASAGQAVSIAGQAARSLEKVVKILEQLAAVMEVVTAVKELVDSLEQIGHIVEAPVMPELPSEADWSIFVNEIEAVAEQMPTEVTEVPVWKAKCKNVAALGREMSITAAYISQLQYDIWVQGMLREIAQSQADKLAAIQPVDLTNYLEMVTQMDMRTSRMLLGLINMLRIQNAALMYEYLLTPTQLTAWPVAMDTVWTLLIQQENSALIGLAQLGPPSDYTSTHVVKDIPVSLLLDGDDWEFEIPVQDGTTFPSSWSRVRIRHLEMHFVQAGGGEQQQIIHQPATQSGSVYILLQGSTIFHDRRRDEVMTFEAAVPLNYHFAYRLDTGETTVTNEPSEQFANTFMQMTPFTRWRLRLSASAAENAGLAFPSATAPDSTTQIVITFHVSAIRQIDWRHDE